MNAKKTYKDIVFAWVLVDVGLPVFVISIFWPVVAFLLKKSHAFDRVFHTADLMPLGAILLLAAVREIETEFQLGRISTTCAKRRILGTVAAIGFLFLYGLFKYYALTVLIPDSATESVDEAISAISLFSIATVAFCGSYSLFLKSSIYRGIGEDNVN